MKYSIKFYPERRKGLTENLPINLSVVYNKQRMFYYTGKRCNADQWDTAAKDRFGNKTPKLKKNQVPGNGQTAQEFMADLDRIKIAVDDLFKIYDMKKEFPTTDQLREDLKIKLGIIVKKSEQENFFERYERFLNRPVIGDGTVLNISNTLNHLKAFDPTITFEKINYLFVSDFNRFLIDKRKLSQNSATSHLIRLSAFLNYCVKNKWIISNTMKGYSFESLVFGDPVYLTLEERDTLFDAKFENKHNNIVRDIFILQCFIGCRFGDLKRLKRSNIINGNIEYIAAKTKEKNLNVARIPLSKKALTIIERYNLPDGRLVPRISASAYNEHIKQICGICEINRLVTVSDKKTRVSKQVPICDIASSHMARRVFIGGLIKKGVLIPIISSMSGHSPDSKAFKRYYHVDNDDQKNAMSLIE
jgi:integrase